MIETYIYVALCMYLGLSTVSGRDKISAILSGALFFYCIMVPYGFYKFLRLYRRVLSQKTIRLQYGSLYTHVDSQKLPALSYNFFQIVKKFVIITVVVMNQDFLALQLAVGVHSQFAFIMYINEIKPLRDPIANAISTINEYALYFILMMTYMFTNYTTVDIAKYEFGRPWIFIVVLVICIDLINLVLSLLLHTRNVLDHWIEVKEKKRRVMKLVKQGKAVLIPSLSEYEKKKEKYRIKQEKVKYKQRRA
jgi:hypothetical protein